MSPESLTAIPHPLPFHLPPRSQPLRQQELRKMKLLGSVNITELHKETPSHYLGSCVRGTFWSHPFSREVKKESRLVAQAAALGPPCPRPCKAITESERELSLGSKGLNLEYMQHKKPQNNHTKEVTGKGFGILEFIICSHIDLICNTHRVN